MAVHGAGVILLETYNRTIPKAHKSGPAVILFLEGGKFTDAGGSCDPGDASPRVTAARELEEESLGLFRINLNRVSSEEVDLRDPRSKGTYRVFFVPVKGPAGKGILRNLYAQNLGVALRSRRRRRTCPASGAKRRA